ncbi:hypothetical protein NMG60_11017916 [Bertholletia excelsa]
MGEAVVSSEEALTLEEVEKEKEEDASASVQKMFLPRMMLRVLLVEADDSTRQIIAALLRKCSYRVASVSDGLKAWEVLKGNSYDIDIILMEVELPSISGFALLTLIMEHDICRNIPVIMMSPHDSVSMVYKCMLRGAADFLVKPVRKNELSNLWQHAWRRKASASCGHGLQNESVAQQNVEATAENNTTSNHSSGYMSSIERNKECIEKGSDEQSSCTMPGVEVKKVSTEHMQDLLQQNWSRSRSSDMKMNRNEECLISHGNLLMHERGLVVDSCKDDNAMTRGEKVNIISEACDNNQTFVNSSIEAIDFIGTFGNSPKCDDNHNTNQVDSSPLLDLSLRGSHPSDSVNQVGERRTTLNHSDASAFSCYVSRTFQPLHLSASVSNQQKDSETISERQLSNRYFNHNSDPSYIPPSSDEAILTLAHDQSGQAEAAFPCPLQPVPLVPVSVRDIRFEGLRSAYGSVTRPMFSTQSSPSSLQSPVSACHSETSFRFNAFHPSSIETKNCGQFDNFISQNATVSINESEHKQGDNSESSDDQCYFSSTTHQTANNSFCHAVVSHINSTDSGSNENVNQIQVIMPGSEGANEEVFPIDGRKYHRSVGREAALTKFRLKRKDRCFEKKVRYESRKKLAEQRPRVKGQFVRRSQADPVPPETND